MNIKEIEELLEKYYEGETTLAEERILKDFFLSGRVPLELAVHENQFRYFAQASRDEINDLELEEKIFTENSSIPGVPMHSRRNRFYYISGIAATILLLIGLLFTFREDIYKRNNIDNSDISPELAFAQTQTILIMVSENFNKGLDKMQYMEKFNEGVRKMQMLSKYYQYQSIIINPDQFENRSAKTK